MTNRDDVLDKIKKLLALSKNNDNENERMAAALKAQKLISEYDVNVCELESGEDPMEEVISSYKSPRAWHKYLAYIIAENFRCKLILTGGVATFFGYKHDAEAAKLVFDYLYRFSNSKGKKVSKTYSPPAGAYNSYVLGFAEGVRIELEKQSEALMIVVPKSVDDAYSDMNLRPTKARALSGDGIGLLDRWELEEEGISDGRDAVRARRMNEPEPQLESYALEGSVC